VFDNDYYQPSYTFNEGSGDNAMTISHEVGHNMGLHHDGTSTTGYYGGHGSGETGWGPIMGAPFGDSMVTWSKGEYPDANNQEDNYQIINNHVPFRTDDHEDVNLAAAMPLQVTGGVNVVSTTRVTDPAWTDLANKGVIEDPTDIDLFSMSVSTGTIDLTIEPAICDTYEGSVGANLDIQARLLDWDGTVLQTSNPDLDLGAAINYLVTVAGDYYIEITGVGRAGTGGSDDGHADYASTGQYYIAGEVPPGIVITDPPVAPDDLLAMQNGDTTIELSWTDPDTLPGRRMRPATTSSARSMAAASASLRRSRGTASSSPTTTSPMATTATISRSTTASATTPRPRPRQSPSTSRSSPWRPARARRSARSSPAPMPAPRPCPDQRCCRSSTAAAGRRGGSPISTTPGP